MKANLLRIVSALEALQSAMVSERWLSHAACGMMAVAAITRRREKRNHNQGGSIRCKR